MRTNTTFRNEAEVDMSDLEHSITTPDIGAGQLPVQVSSWLVEIGEYVFEGDRIVELMVPGLTFDVQAPVEGKLLRIDKFSGAIVQVGEALGCLLSPANLESA
jgi:pyruvate/2-oxoglutarate dehydrogenase complex dihydrolipoamide acyltransferase (E2) component